VRGSSRSISPFQAQREFCGATLVMYVAVVLFALPFSLLPLVMCVSGYVPVSAFLEAHIGAYVSLPLYISAFSISVSILVMSALFLLVLCFFFFFRAGLFYRHPRCELFSPARINGYKRTTNASRLLFSLCQRAFFFSGCFRKLGR
jgi:hypothetical protein